MESRKVLFVLTNSSGQKTITSAATTLSELKVDMRSAGISYDNMTFFEGRTRTELKDDNSLLPTNIPVPSKGTTEASVTNDLVFMLTTANKKIRSGAMSRTEAYAAIKANNLQSKCMSTFGKNFTQCSTTDLISLLGGYSAPASTPVPSKPAKAEKVKPQETAKVEEPSTETAETEKGNMSVLITDVGTNKLAVVKAVKELTGLSLKEAKDLVDGVPSRISELTKSQATMFVHELREVGVEVTIETDSATEGIKEPKETIESVGASTVVVPVDSKLRLLVYKLLNLMIEEEMLEEDYTDLLDEANELLEEPTNVVTSTQAQIIPSSSKTVVSANEGLSGSAVSAMFGSWCK